MKRMPVSLALVTLVALGILLNIDKIEAQDMEPSRMPFTKEEFPNPRHDYEECGRGKESWICDPGRYLNASDGDRLDNMVQFMKDAKTCLCDDASECYGDYRHEVLVAVVPRIKFSDGKFPKTYEDQKLAAKEFANYLRDEAWKSQGKQCRMRVFIVTDMHTKIIWTATNYYAMKIISDRKAKGVGLDAKTEFFSKGLLFKGLESMIFEYRNFLFHAPEYVTIAPTQKPRDREDGGGYDDQGAVPWWKPFTGVLTTFLLIALIVLICCCVCRNVDWMSHGLPGGIWFPSSGGPSFGIAPGYGGGACGGGWGHSHGGGWHSGGGGNDGGGGDWGGGGDFEGGGGDDGGGGGGGGCGGGGACGADGDNFKPGGGGGG